MSNPARCTGTTATQLVSSTSTQMAVGPWDLSKCTATSQVRVRNSYSPFMSLRDAKGNPLEGDTCINKNLKDQLQGGNGI